MNAEIENTTLWHPSDARIAGTNLVRFIAFVNDRHNLSLANYDQLHVWSVEAASEFWHAVWDFTGVVGEPGEVALHHDGHMIDARFFPDARLNFAENLLRRSDDSEAIAFWAEDQLQRSMSWKQLRTLVSQLQQLMAAAGVGVGDRVAAYLPNMPETVAIMLAASGLGATLSTASPDFGVQGVLDRFGQIEPKLLFVTDGYWFGGKSFDVREKSAEVASKLTTVREVIEVPLLGLAPGDVPQLGARVGQFIGGAIHFEPLPFDHPLYIQFSSGTTGAPKCIVHRAGGILLTHLKEHQLNGDIKAGDRVFFFTTTGWMMWNWLVTALASDATILLYDGSPLKTPNILFDFAQAQRATGFGVSAKYIDAIGKAGIEPRKTHDLSSIRTIWSTGSPLVHEGFDYVYRAISGDVHLASVSGGTDLCGCLVGGNPMGSVHRGEVQTSILGIAADAVDDELNSIRDQKGDLVVRAPFPSQPLTFYGPGGDQKYRAAYFEKYPGVPGGLWAQGDFVERSAVTGGWTFYGRSDATLNPGGVRIGTAEIYRQVEQLAQIQESIVIGQDWDNDTRVVLFVRLADGAILDDDLEKQIRSKIRIGASPRHVPAKIVAVADIPRTKSGKIVELAVRDIVHGRSIKNVEALANPEALDLYRDLDALAG